MTVKQHLRVLREQWWLVLVCVVLGVGAAAAFAFTQRPEYAAHLQLFVSTADTNSAQSAYSGGLFGQQRVKSYADIVASERVVSGVRDELNLDMTTKALQKEISATAPPDTVLVDVTVTDPSPARAQAIANAVGDQFAALVNDLETPQGQRVSPVKVSTVQAATLPSLPVSPRIKLDLALGLLIGLAVGIGVAFLRETLDTTVSSKEQAAELADGPVLAAFREDDKVKERPLIVSDGSFSPRAEAFRQLRTNIRYVSVDSSVRSMVVTSSIECEGKTTVATNLAIALAQNGEQVILVDADLRRPMVAEVLGLNPAIGLTNVLVGTTHLDAALQNWRQNIPLKVLTSGEVPPNPSEMLGSHRMRDLLSELLKRSTVVIFDTPPLLPVTDGAILAAMTDGALLVTRVGKTKRDALASSAGSLRHVGAQVLGVVLNRVPSRKKSSSYGYSYSYGGYYATRPAAAPDESSAGVTPVDLMR